MSNINAGSPPALDKKKTKSLIFYIDSVNFDYITLTDITRVAGKSSTIAMPIVRPVNPITQAPESWFSVCIGIGAKIGHLYS